MPKRQKDPRPTVESEAREETVEHPSVITVGGLTKEWDPQGLGMGDAEWVGEGAERGSSGKDKTEGWGLEDPSASRNEGTELAVSNG